jgi:hypothetical protein
MSRSSLPGDEAVGEILRRGLERRWLEVEQTRRDVAETIRRLEMRIDALEYRLRRLESGLDVGNEPQG